MESLFKLGILLRVMDMVSGPVQQIGRSIDALHKKAEALQPVFDKFRDYGKWIAGAGVAGALGLGVLVHQYGNLEEAQIGLQTTLMNAAGVVAPEYAKLNKLAEKLGTDLPGSTKDMIGMFISLRENGVQTNQILTGLGESAADLAVVLKLSFYQSAEFVAQFSHALGIADSDVLTFVDHLQRMKFASGVKSEDLAYTFKYMGGGLKMLSLQGIDAAREISVVIGMLARAGIRGETSGTGMNAAFVRMAEISSRLERGLAKKLAGPILNKYGIELEFFTSKGSFIGLRPMIAELEKLKGLTDQEKMTVLSKLFGRDAGMMAVLSELIKSGVAGYDKMSQQMYNQADLMTKIKLIMSGVNMQGETLSGTFANLVAHLGGAVTKSIALKSIMSGLNDLVGRMDAWVVLHPEAAGNIATVALALTGFLLVAGGLLLTIGVGGALITKMIVGFGLLAQAIAWLKLACVGAIPAVWGFTTALLANPITWIVIAVVAVIGALAWLYTKFEAARTAVQFFNFFLGFLLGNIWRVAEGFYLAFRHPLQFIAGLGIAIYNIITGIGPMLLQAGKSIIDTISNGVKARAPWLHNMVSGVFGTVRNLLPFSDAKEGPLSQLTLSGRRIMETMGMGITSGAPGLQRAMATALAGAALTTSIAVAPPAFSREQAATPPTANASARRDGKKFEIHIHHLELPNVSNPRDFTRQLQALVEGYDVNEG